MEKICKIVYFDEGSVSDHIQIVAGGELEKNTELLDPREGRSVRRIVLQQQQNGKEHCKKHNFDRLSLNGG